jgi:hypothetical protein
VEGFDVNQENIGSKGIERPWACHTLKPYTWDGASSPNDKLEK